MVNPRAFRELFPEVGLADFPFRQPVTAEAVYLLSEHRAQRIPTPPTMHNQNFFTASLCEIVRWLGERAEAAGVNTFTGFPVGALLVDGDTVQGAGGRPIRTGSGGQTGERLCRANRRHRSPSATVLAEGTRGTPVPGLLRVAADRLSQPPALCFGCEGGVGDRQTPRRLVHHWGGRSRDAFGGSFMYPLGPSQTSLGLVVGLDYHDASLDVHQLLQQMKLHPLFRQYLEGGQLLEWGAKTIPEGGYYSVPARRHGKGVLMVGDAAGFVDVPSLKGIHYAMQSGIYAARAAYKELRTGNSSAALADYDRMVNESYLIGDLYRTRNMRLAFRDGFVVGGIKAGLMTLTGGRFPGKQIPMNGDAAVARNTGNGNSPAVGPLTISKLDAVFKSGNATRDTIPSHLLVGPDITPEVADFYSHLCPAGVYEPGGRSASGQSAELCQL